MNNQPLVTIISPCFNGGSYVFRFFESLLRQSYSNIQLIFVNDHSDDNTEQVFLSYKKKLEEKGFSITYIFNDKNLSAAGCINEALPLVRGEFLSWPDSDDFLEKESIKNKVSVFIKNPDISIVFGKACVLDEESLLFTGDFLRIKRRSRKYIFDNLIFENGVYYAPVGYMVRTKALFKHIPDKRIFCENKTGQNWQLLLPLVYKEKCGYLNKNVGFYIVRQNSTSHNSRTYEAKLLKTFKRRETLQEAIKSVAMDGSIKNDYLEKVDVKYSRIRLELAAANNDSELVETEYVYLESRHSLNRRCIYLHNRANYKLIKILFDFYDFSHKTAQRIKRKINRILFSRRMTKHIKESIGGKK